MHVITPNSAFDIPLPNRSNHASRSVRPGTRRWVRLLSAAVQSVMFFAVLWLLAAGPGFLSARDSTVPAGMARPAAQASR